MNVYRCLQNLTKLKTLNDKVLESIIVFYKKKNSIELCSMLLDKEMAFDRYVIN